MRALIIGITGQDGAYLAELLLTKGYEVIGTSRDIKNAKFNNLESLGIKDSIQLLELDVYDLKSIQQILFTIKPSEVYNLSGQSSVGRSFIEPYITFKSMMNVNLNCLEAIRSLNENIRFYNAGSGEIFGDTNGITIDEETPFNPSSPYSVAKLSAYYLVKEYRQQFEVFACTGILFNHESPFRNENFVTQKIISSALNISKGKQKQLSLGNIDIFRDWGWAPDYVESMWKMLQAHQPKDYVIATGYTVSLKYFVEKVFSYFDLDWEKFVVIDDALFRPTDIKRVDVNPAKIYEELNWKANTSFEQMIEKLCSAYLKK